MVPNAASTAWPHNLFSYRADKYTKEYNVPSSIGRSQHYRPTWDGYFHQCSPSQLSDSLGAGNFLLLDADTNTLIIIIRSIL